MRFAAVADDITGGTDLASALRRADVDVVQTFGRPARDLPPADAIVISLKTRTEPAAEAITASIAAARTLKAGGADQIYFKYCSTFDSTEKGNIGPVLDALLDELDVPMAIACPAYPRMGRTVYAGHLFVNQVLLSESPMRHHPLTPMTDANLVRFLGRQMRAPVGQLSLDLVERGVPSIRAALETLAEDGRRVAIADAILDRHIQALAEATVESGLASGGAALGGALGAMRVPRGRRRFRTPMPTARTGPVAILSGSCSAATREQIGHLGERVPARTIDPVAVARDPPSAAETAAWCARQARSGHDVLLQSTTTPDGLRDVREALGREQAARHVEAVFRIATAALADAGVRTFIVAGGETSGAVAQALGVSAMRLGSEIESGVPWAQSIDPPGFRLALKSGNFGSPDFFVRALKEAHGRV